MLTIIIITTIIMTIKCQLLETPIENVVLNKVLNIIPDDATCCLNSTNAHPVSFLTDNNLNTNWISSIAINPITIYFDIYNGTTMIGLVDRIEIYFTSLPPENLIIEGYLNNEWTLLQLYSINCNTRNDSCIQLSK
jgi:hypothetical protein